MGSRIGDWELIDRFAVGGVAELYRARHANTGEIAVIKRMRQDLEFDPEHQAGFLRELQVAMLAQHKNLIRGLARGTLNGLDYGVLEYVDGRDLSKLLSGAHKAQIALPEEFAVFVARELLEGIELAHALKGADGKQMGLVHRDLTPRNVFVSSKGEVKIGDFGSALASKVERAGDVVGTVGYMSPEQAGRQQLDVRSDIYAIGLVLYEMLAGRPALELPARARRDDATVLRMHAKPQVRPLPPSVPDNLRLIVETAIAADRDDRFQEPRAMRSALARCEHPPKPTTQIELAALLRTLFGAQLEAEQRALSAPRPAEAP